MKQYVVTYDSGWIDIPIAVFTSKKQAISYAKEQSYLRPNNYSVSSITKVYMFGAKNE